MSSRRALAALVVVLIMMAGIAQAESTQSESIKGRLGITARVGGQIPAKDDNSMLQPESSFAGGGGLIFGITDMLAIEADVAHMPNIEFNNTSGKLRTTDVSIGLQIRNRIDNLTAYLGIGADVLLGSGDSSDGTSVDMDTTYGGHIRGGGDYFITRNVALNLDLRGSFFPNTDIRQGGVVVADYNPICFIGTVGVRVFLW